MMRGLVSTVFGCALAACGTAATAPHAIDAGAAQSGAMADASRAIDVCAGFGDEACAAPLRALIQPLSLPEARGNAVADDEDAAVLGFHIFFDIRFSHDRTVRCETCHSVDYGFADNSQVPTMGAGPGVRNSPTIFDAARHSIFMWDGRADTLWSQPLLALENSDEMNFTRLEIAHALETLYASEYEKAFGSRPDFSRFPDAGKPGDAAFDGMSDADKFEVNRAVANVGKALEAYMRKLATGPSRVDRYLASRFGVDPDDPAADPDLLTSEEQRGALVFASVGCPRCHSGAQLSDDQFHNLGVPGLPGAPPDAGRTQVVLDQVENSPFNMAGAFYDGMPEAAPPSAAVLGGFRTPSLRNLTRSAPYGHNGVFATLEDVVDFHLAGGGDDPSTFVGDVDPMLREVQLSQEDRAALIAFLKALDGAYPALPWGQWPSGNG